MYDYTLHRGRKHYYRYCLEAFRTADVLKTHIKNCFKINGKQRSKMQKKKEYAEFKNYERKIKSPYIIYADFEGILVPEDNGKQNRKESYINNYQKNVGCSYSHNHRVLMINLSSLLTHIYVKNFINSMIEESKYCSDKVSITVKKYFNLFSTGKNEKNDF